MNYDEDGNAGQKHHARLSSILTALLFLFANVILRNKTGYLFTNNRLEILQKQIMDERSVEEVGIQHDLRGQAKEHGYEIRHDSYVKVLSHDVYQGGFLLKI